MPTLQIKTPAGAFTTSQCRAMLSAVEQAAVACSGLGPLPHQRRLCWVLHEPVAHWRCGDEDTFETFVPVLVQVLAPAGVLDAERRTRYARAVHDAIVGALAHPESRRLALSITVSDVADGTWGANGELWNLARFAAVAGYAHMQA
ncbi:hypothetical protein ROV96_17170 [Stenotrophomonas pavanii]|uniref:tautomerase family protein n=1 Tax=Stenotrophomonas pavanii TaxID=487698 RepID=UPI002893F3BF|nr:hypothetical protein [Stenotrophomonas pavanii]MDT3457509.1 hypothetical protein [Stenotrophomonas pavanii]MDT3465678.1 hypothetical protein [Stenotrophomonas pavanii]